MSRIRVLVGTKKGAFILTADGQRRNWQVSGPHFAGWELYHLKGSPVDPDRSYVSQTSGWLPATIPLLFLAALSFSAIGLLFTAILPSIDYIGRPFFLVIMPIGFASSTYFPMPDLPWLQAAVQLNPLNHLAEGLRWLLIHGRPTWHPAAAAGLSVLILLLLVPLDQRRLRRRVLGDV